MKKSMNLADVHDLAYWGQWRLAVHGVCAQFDAAVHTETDCAREQEDHANIARHAALSDEIRHLERQLGRHASVNSKLEASFCENRQALVKAESARVAAVASADRLQTQICREKQTAAACTKQLENEVAQFNAFQKELRAEVVKADAAQRKNAERTAAIHQGSQARAAQLITVRQEVVRAKEESRSERIRAEAMQHDLATLRDVCSDANQRFANAKRKEERLRAERNDLRRKCALLEDKLADVEKFQKSRRGCALDSMEQELASERIARVELQAHRDDLQSQLAAALQRSRRK